MERKGQLSALAIAMLVAAVILVPLQTRSWRERRAARARAAAAAAEEAARRRAEGMTPTAQHEGGGAEAPASPGAPASPTSPAAPTGPAEPAPR